jgi:hypothetical protein
MVNPDRDADSPAAAVVVTTMQARRAKNER